jgi:hypothetical protein
MRIDVVTRPASLRGTLVMHALLPAIGSVALPFTTAAWTQTASSSSSPGPGSSASSNAKAQIAPAGPSRVMTQDKLRKTLQEASFQDIRILDAAYLVQARTKDGDPVVLSIYPPEATTTGSTASGGSGSSANTGSAGPLSRQRR